VSPIGNEVWDVDANTGINQVIPSPASVPTGTIVVVVWQDGTTAQFIRTNSVPTVLWVYVPGSMKNKAGQPITPISGTQTKNPNSGGTGSGVIIPTVTGSNPWYLQLTGGNTCTGTTTLTIPEEGDYIFQFYFPC
jgi:hypothetical protein